MMFKKKFHTVRVAVYLLLKDEDHILLMRRYNTGFMDGYYSLPAGHIEKGENPMQALIRETEEETGLILEEKDISCAHIMYRKEKTEEYVDFFFVAEKYEVKLMIMEPKKCDDMRWFSLFQLPQNLVPYVGKAIYDIANHHSFYSEFGWDREKDER